MLKSGIKLIFDFFLIRSSDQTPYIEVNFLEPKLITGVVTRGDGKTENWVRTFTVSTSIDGANFSPYSDGGIPEPKLFNGNEDKTTAVTNFFNRQVIAQYVRIHPKSVNGETSLQFNVLGCNPAQKPGPTTPSSVVPETDEFGNPILIPKTDEYGRPLTDFYGQTIMVPKPYTQGQPTPAPATDEHGDPILVPKTDTYGKPMTDEQGHTIMIPLPWNQATPKAVPKTDPFGNPILVPKTDS